jgi:hypothetical protein
MNRRLFMCIPTILRTKKIQGTKAIMEDGREVLLGGVRHVVPGDMLRVYANLAIEKTPNSRKDDTP